ncbi:MAG: hypothetical protein ACKVLD_06230 [Flavobacteriales bacterium]|jgi:hypothetical protein|tara:strand:- start:135 stop:323 length:189 start_codon:yes stop_codon:yes gene_type:complete
MLKEKKISEKKERILEKIRNRTTKVLPKIIFTSKNLTVTLKSKEQLKKWLQMYPEGSYTTVI